MTRDDEHLERQDANQPPAPGGEQAPPPAPHEFVLQAAETARRIVEREPR